MNEIITHAFPVLCVGPNHCLCLQTPSLHLHFRLLLGFGGPGTTWTTITKEEGMKRSSDKATLENRGDIKFGVLMLLQMEFPALGCGSGWGSAAGRAVS